MSDDDELALATTPRGNLSVRLIREFVNSAHGPNDDLLRHFLPRMLELVAEGENLCAIEDCLGLKKLGDCKGLGSNYRDSWSSKEVATIDDFYQALFEDALSLYPEDIRAERTTSRAIDITYLLQTIAVGGGELAPLLAIWDEARSRLATLHLATLTYWAARAGEAPGGFWDYAPEARKVLTQWLQKPEHWARLNQAALQETDEGAFEWLAMALAEIDHDERA